MKLIAQVKLQPNPEQTQALRETIRRVNLACAYISDCAWTNQTFGQYRLQQLVYRHVRERFGLSAQLAVRAIAKVADAYKLDRKSQRTFKPLRAITYDDRILSWKLDQSLISINTVHGRLKIPFVCGERQRELLQSRQGESDLILFRDHCYIHAVCNVEEPLLTEGQDVLGLDMGIVNICVDSDGNIYSAKTVNRVRARHRHLRSQLQKKGTKSAKRLLRKLSGREARFARDTNHTISKQVVRLAKDTSRDIAIEELTGIRGRVTVRRSQRAQHASWSFSQLREFLTYKAQLHGVKLVTVDPRHTSRTCPACSHISKQNRPSQSVFRCTACGFSGFADHIAAINIGRRASVNAPNVSTTRFSPSPVSESLVAPGTSHLL